jgi:hypothetical protein
MQRRLLERNPLPMHIQRVMAEVRLIGTEEQEAISWDIRLLLNDITHKGVGLFSSVALMPGQEVLVRLQEPRPFFLRGRVVYCREYDTISGIVSAQSFTYRVGIKFQFESLEEERMVKSFCDFLATELYGA